MAVKRPLCNYAGDIKELSETDSLVAMGMWDIDGDGDLMPSSTIRPDPYWTVDEDGDLIPI